MNRLPTSTRTWPLIRLVARVWDGPRTAWGPWAVVAEANPVTAVAGTPGLVVDFFERLALPQVGAAAFSWISGTINGRTFGSAAVPDLANAEVRIQVSPAPAFGANRQTFTPVWRTAWWGTVEHQVDDATGGVRRYQAFDGLYRATRWRMNRFHTAYCTLGYGLLNPPSPGHPGYNVALDDWYARVLGNRDANTDQLYDPTQELAARGSSWANPGFAPPGDGAIAWTDRAVIESALQSARGPGDPIFAMRGAMGILSNTTRSWPVSPGQDAWSLVARICDRRRGRGSVFVDWDEAGPLGELTPWLSVRPQTRADVTWTNPSDGSTGTYPGAASSGYATTVDVANDPRLVNGSVQVSVRAQTRYDYVETVGEPIQVLVNLSTRGVGVAKSLIPRWSLSDEVAFTEITNPRWRSSSRWDPVYQRWGLNPAWSGQADDGDTSASISADYACKDDGTIQPNGGNLSVCTARVLPTLPLYEAWDYRSNPPVRYDGATDLLPPPRRPLLALRRESADAYLDLRRIGFTAELDPFYGLLITYGPDQDDTRGTRYFSGVADLGGAGFPDDLVVAAGLELGARVRLASGNPTGRRRQYIEVSGLHLWLAHPLAIWDLDRVTTAEAAAPALRGAAGAAGSEPGLLRDDRKFLAQVHALNCAWYLTDHRPVEWSLMDCGVLPTFTLADGTVQNFPVLGMFLTTFTWRDRAGVDQTATSDTPITGVRYDNHSGVTTWTTDWADLDTSA
jgi:hypothetical protein